MSSSSSWKKKFEKAQALLREKEKLLKEYQSAIQESQETIKTVREKLSAELKIAHHIHRILIPTEIPIIDNCEFSFKFQPAEAESLSKDFYEVLPHPSVRSFSMIMSSCSSHSLSALLFSARLKMMGRGEGGTEHLKPLEFITQLRKGITEDLSPVTNTKAKQFLKGSLSMFYALINQKTYQMSYFLTGNILALSQCGQSGAIENLKPSINDFFGQIKTHKLCLNGKDRLLLLSPGVLNCARSDGALYSFTSLKEAIQEESSASTHELRNRIFYDLKAFAKNHPQESDQSVLIMEVKDKILKLQTFE